MITRLSNWLLTALQHSRSRMIFIVLITSAAGLGFAYLALARPWGPRLYLCDGLLLDLGTGNEGERLTAEYTIVNRGWKELRFYFNAGCSCATFEPKQGILSPGESLPIKVGLQLRREGTEQRIMARIETNDPDRASAPLMLVARCPAEIVSEPCLVDFGSILSGSSPTRDVRVSFPKLGDAPSPEKLAVMAGDQHVSANVLADGAALALAVRLDALAPIGHYSTVLRLRYSGIEHQIEIPIVGEVCGALQVAPASIWLPSLSQGDKGQRILIWRTDHKALGKPRRVAAPAGIRVSQEQTIIAGRSIFCVRRDPSSTPADGREIIIGFEENQEVRIPLRGDHPGSLGNAANRTGVSAGP